MHKICVYAWFGDHDILAPYVHNEIFEVEDHIHIFDIARGFYDRGLNVMIRHGKPDASSVLFVSKEGFGCR